MNPTFSAGEAERLAGELYGIKGYARPFHGYWDQNFLIETDTGEKFVLKIANAAERREVLDAQNLALQHVAQQDPSLRCPHACSTPSGELIADVPDANGEPNFVRMLTFVPGIPLSEVHPHSPELLRSVGNFFGRLDHALGGFSHPATRRDLHWDLKRADFHLRAYLEHISDVDRLGIVERHLSEFEANVVPAFHELRTSVIHNDGNDYNVLVSDRYSTSSSAVGVIDFGDMVESATVCEVAICAAYGLLDKEDPWSAAAAIIRGYHEAYPLTELELDLLPQLIMMRLSLSVAISAYQKKQHPTNEYLMISERPAWDALQLLAELGEPAHGALRPA